MKTLLPTHQSFVIFPDVWGTVKFTPPNNNAHYNLRELQLTVAEGGYIEFLSSFPPTEIDLPEYVSMPDREVTYHIEPGMHTIVFSEDYPALLPTNPRASDMFGQPIRGPVLVTTTQAIDPPETEEDE